MAELDIVRDLAKEVLTIPTLRVGLDNYLWDRAQRLVCNVEHICQLPELGKAGLQIDRFCLIAATYFSDAGLAHFLRAKEAAAKLAISDANDNDLLDFCTQIVEEKLKDVIDEAKIEKINRIITESCDRFTRRPEAMILSDARNLDDVGVTGIFNEFRQLVFRGKGVSDALQSWKRKVDYGYWQARLKEGFRFESVRKLAERRLLAAEYLMNQLGIETEAQELEELIIESLERK